MSLLDVFITALVALRSNFLRTLLTMLGIIIGIASVIALTAAGEGAQQGVADRIRGLGSNLMFVRPYSAQPAGGLASVLPGAGPSLFYEDANAIAAANIPGIDSIASQTVVGLTGDFIQAKVIYRSQNIKTTLVGTEPSYQQVRDFYVANGRFLSEDDVSKKGLVVVLGAGIAQDIFGDKDPIGETVGIFAGPSAQFGVRFSFTVVGVMEKKGASAQGNQDDQVFVPLPSFQARVAFIRNARGYTNVQQINIKVADQKAEASVKLAIADVLRKQHNVINEDDFQIQSQSDVLSTATSVDRTLQVLLVSIAIIALVVGGIGIMNIMLVSVSERTREIGIRKAVGAKRLDILMQFVIEALVVTTIGGAIGVLAGVGAIEFAKYFEIGGSDTKYLITPFWVGMGLSMSAVTGLVFGVYPAWRASRLDPIEALRRE
ncbi:MAG: ABC transporter permease [Chloroflexota bacterium]